MDVGGIIIASIGALVGLFSAGALIVKSRGENKNKAAEVYSAAEDMVAARVKADLAGAYASIDELKNQVKDLVKQVTDLNNKHIADSRQKAEMVRHIVALEKLIPDPPGIPARPEWRVETD